VSIIYGDYEYEVINEHEARILDYLGADTSVTIPGSLEEKTVTRIGINAFRSKELTDVTFPLSLVFIENDAFRDNSLTSLYLPPSVEGIGNRAFRDNSLDYFAFEHDFSVGIGAFQDNPFGTGVHVGVELTEVGAYPFVFCSLGDRLTFGENLTVIPREIGRMAGLTEVSIPDTVTVIEGAAFRDNSLSSISFPDGLLEIEDHAFRLNDLTSLSLPDTVSSVGRYAFGNNNLDYFAFEHDFFVGSRAFEFNPFGTGVHLGVDITSAESYVFAGCGLEDRLTIASGITRIPYAFSGFFRNAGLTKVTFPESMEYIGRNAFQENSLEVVELHGAVEEVDDNVFEDNDIELFIVHSSETSFSTFGGGVLAGNPGGVIRGWPGSTAETLAGSYEEYEFEAFGEEEEVEEMAADVSLRVFTGTDAGTKSDPVDGIDFISADNAVNNLTNRQNNPIVVPGSGENYSFEKWLKLELDTAPDNEITNIQFWGPSSYPTGTGVNVGTTQTGATPTDSESSVATEDVTTYTSGNKLEWDDGSYSATGLIDEFLVLQLEVDNNASPGNWDQQTYYYSYDEM